MHTNTAGFELENDLNLIKQAIPSDVLPTLKAVYADSPKALTPAHVQEFASVQGIGADSLFCALCRVLDAGLVTG